MPKPDLLTPEGASKNEGMKEWKNEGMKEMPKPDLLTPEGFSNIARNVLIIPTN